MRGAVAVSAELDGVPVTDGINHPSDGHSTGVVGVLTFTSSTVSSATSSSPEKA